MDFTCHCSTSGIHQKTDQESCLGGWQSSWQWFDTVSRVEALLGRWLDWHWRTLFIFSTTWWTLLIIFTLAPHFGARHTLLLVLYKFFICWTSYKLFSLDCKNWKKAIFFQESRLIKESLVQICQRKSNFYSGLIKHVSADLFNQPVAMGKWQMHVISNEFGEMSFVFV